MRAIDGDALSDWLKDYGQKCIKGERKNSLMYVWKHIQDMPTIEPDQEKPAKWIIYEVANCDGEPPIAWECPECGEVVDCKYKFCPECGKPMEV